MRNLFNQNKSTIFSRNILENKILKSELYYSGYNYKFNILHSLNNKSYSAKSESKFSTNENINSKSEKKVYTLWQRIGIPFANIMLLGTSINLFLQAYWYQEYYDIYDKDSDIEIKDLEIEIKNLESKLAIKNS